MNRKITLYAIIFIFLISVIPLFYIGRYAHPSVDDYFYGAATHQVYEDTGNIGDVIKTSYNEMKQTYMDWQGNFSAIFLMRLQPGIFGEKYYVITPIILISSFVISMLWFIYTALRKWFNADRITGIGVAVAVTFCALEFTHTPSDSFYWFNGSIYYTFFFSMMLVLLTLVTLFLRSERKAIQIISIVFAIPVAFLIGGSNYVTALLTAIILVLATIIYGVRKDKKAFLLAVVMFAALSSLLISINAPGNAIRQASVGGNTGLIKSLVYSFSYGAYNIANASCVPVIIMFISLLPVFYNMVKNSKFSFRFPLLVLLLTYGIFCAQGMPVFYAQGLKMPYRMMNIIYFMYYIFMGFNLIYLMGYLSHRFKDSVFDRFMETAYKKMVVSPAVTLTLIFCFIVGCVGRVKVDANEEQRITFENLPASVSATYSLINGEAKQYDKELSDRIRILENCDEPEIEVAPLSAAPEVIFHSDITNDPAHWKNQHLSLYYGIERISTWQENKCCSKIQ